MLLGVSDVALYFPYVNLPGDAWVKAAALHWPQLGRMRPFAYYGLRDSDAVRQLRDEEDFVVDVRPGGGPPAWVDRDAVARVGAWARDERWMGIDDQVDVLFYDFLDRYRDELIPRYGVEALGVTPLDSEHVYDELLPLDPRLEKVHPGKVSYALALRLADDGLIARRSYYWRRADDDRVLHVGDLAMHRRLAGLYLAVLADVVARENEMTPVSDQPLMCAVTSGWTVESMAAVLLGEDHEGSGDGGQGEVGDYAQVFAVLALQTVLPRDLEAVPVGRIIEARRRLLPELMRYRAYLDSLAPDFVQISALPDPAVRAVKLRNHVESRIAQPLAAMERELGRLGLQPVRAVLTLQTLAPPAALGVLSGALHLPSAVTSAGVAAGCVVGAVNGALDQRRRTLAGHPTGYLLGLQRELGPSETVARIRGALRRAASGGRPGQASRS